MTWNHRVIKEDGLYYLAEVIYEDGITHSWTEPLTEMYESREELVRDLKMMLKGSKQNILLVGN